MYKWTPNDCSVSLILKQAIFRVFEFSASLILFPTCLPLTRARLNI